MKVFIVDDEFLLCEHIKRTIDWESIGMEVTGCFHDGRQALDAVEELQPDIVLTDISMPVMDGLELAKELHKKYPQIAVMIITGYSEFEYAQSAIRYGVKQYLLKPIEKEPYTKALLETKAAILDRENDYQKGIKKEEINQKRWETVKEYLAGDITAEELEERLGTLGEEIPGGEKVVLAFQYKRLKLAADEVGDFRRNIILRFMEAFLLKDREGFVVCNEKTGIAVLSSGQQYREELILRLERLCIRLEQDEGLSLFAGVSQSFRELQQISSCYEQAKRAMESRFVCADCKVITCEEACQDETFLLSRYVDGERMLQDLRNNRREELMDGENGINGIFRKLKKDNSSKDNAVFAAIMCVSIINEFLMETSLLSVGINSSELMQEASSKESLEELRDFVAMLMDKALNDVFGTEYVKSSARVEDAKRYIKEHLLEPGLSLQTVADGLFINKTYLSDLFKKETGQTVVKYILRSRLNLAKKELDENPEQDLYTVAINAGFSNEYYFIRCFKKQFGITPGSYAKLKR